MNDELKRACMEVDDQQINDPKSLDFSDIYKCGVGAIDFSFSFFFWISFCFPKLQQPHTVGFGYYYNK